MAIQATFATNAGVIMENQYGKIIDIQIMEKTKLRVDLGFAQNSSSNVYESITRFYDFDVSDTRSIYTIAYEKIKQEFPDSIDV